METLDELRERRAFECRLTPDRSLQSLDEAEAFLLDRGLLTRTWDSALPALYDACHEEAYKPDSGGFGEWPRTKWPWFGEVAERGYLVVAVHRGKNLLVSHTVAALLDPICRAEIERMRAAAPDWDRLLDHLSVAGPSSIGDLQVELDLKPKELKATRAPLERCGAIVARSLGAHSSELWRWDQAYTRTSDGDVRRAFGELLVAGIGAAVVAPERELERWFSWQWYWDSSIIDDLVREERLRRVHGHIALAS